MGEKKEDAVPETECWCTVAVRTLEGSRYWLQVAPLAAAPSAWHFLAKHGPRLRLHTSWRRSLWKKGLHTAAGQQRRNVQ